MKKDLTEIICIIDESGSMDSTRNDVIGGFNSFIKEQKELPGEALVTLVFFDHEYRLVHLSKNIKEIPELNHSNYKPRGTTALLDAIGRTINDVGHRLYIMPEQDRPEKVIVLIITDGHENASREFTKEKIKEMTKHQQEKYSWEFIYLGANQDAFSVGSGLGFVHTSNYVADSQGTKAMYAGITRTVSSYRSSGKIDLQDSLNQTQEQS